MIRCRRVLTGLASAVLFLAGAHSTFAQTTSGSGFTLPKESGRATTYKRPGLPATATDNSAIWGSLFKNQIARCWRKPEGGPETPQFEAEFEIKLERNGTLAATPIAKTSPASEYQRAFIESGLHAIIRCAPYKLPQASFDEWKMFFAVFGNRETL
jgi:hypothetical protein